MKRFGIITKIFIVLFIIVASCKFGWEWASWDIDKARMFWVAMAYEKGFENGYNTAVQEMLQRLEGQGGTR